MKSFCVIIFCLVCSCINAQSTTVLAYDANGNRISKKIQGSSPNPSVVASPESVTLGQITTLTASGCPGIIQWSTGQQGTSISVTPSLTNYQYTAECKTANCNKNGTGKVIVNVLECPPPVITLTANYTAIYPGQQVTLNALGCPGPIKWISDRSTVDARSTNVITVQPDHTTYYSALCTQPGCKTGSGADIKIQADCLVDPVTIFVSANPVTFGQYANMVAYNCVGTIQWSTGGFGPTTVIQVFGTDNTIYATCQKPYCPNSGRATVTVNGIFPSAPCSAGDALVSIKVGDWNDPTTWQCGRIPSLTDNVYLKHAVTLSVNGNAKNVIYGEGYLIYQNNAFINYPQ